MRTKNTKTTHRNSRRLAAHGPAPPLCSVVRREIALKVVACPECKTRFAVETEEPDIEVGNSGAKARDL